MAKSKAPLLTASRKKPKLGKSNSKIARKGKGDQKFVNNSSKTVERKIRVLLRVNQPKPLGRIGRIREAHVRRN